MAEQRVALPYVNNAKAVLITLVINVGVVFLFNWPGGITLVNVMVDTAICVVITTAIDLCIVYFSLKKMKSTHSMPSQVPESKLMQKLPQNPLALGVVFIVIFCILALSINALVLWFFGMQEMTFVPWLAYKLIYATFLSIKITEYCIFRYVQPDWAPAKTSDSKETPGQTVKNPLPKMALFKEVTSSIVGNIAMNIIIGTALGGVILLSDASVLLMPSTVTSIPITGFVFGLILGVLVTRGVTKEMKSVILAAGPDIKAAVVVDKRLSWMPERTGSLACLICVCTMAFSVVALPALMTLFGLTVLNFYQYTVFITLYAALVSKPLSAVLVKRCMQPDYIDKVLNARH